MKYNLSKIMKAAHSLRKEGYSMSTALKVAWCQAKIEEIKSSDGYFLLQMSDRFSSEERDQDAQYSIRIRELGYRIWECKMSETIFEYDRYGKIIKTSICAA